MQTYSTTSRQQMVFFPTDLLQHLCLSLHLRTGDAAWRLVRSCYDVLDLAAYLHDELPSSAHSHQQRPRSILKLPNSALGLARTLKGSEPHEPHPALQSPSSSQLTESFPHTTHFHRYARVYHPFPIPKLVNSLWPMSSSNSVSSF